MLLRDVPKSRPRTGPSGLMGGSSCRGGGRWRRRRFQLLELRRQRPDRLADAGPLVELPAQALGVGPATLFVHPRRLREAGHLDAGLVRLPHDRDTELLLHTPAEGVELLIDR